MANFSRLVWITLLIPLLVSASTGISYLRVTQAAAEGPDIKAYLHVRNAAGQSPAELEPGQLGVYIGDHRAEVQSVERVSESKEGIGYVFLIDISRSLTSRQFGQIKSALIDWIRNMGPQDRAAVITFGNRVTMRRDLTGDRRALELAIASVKRTDLHTSLYAGLLMAMDLSPARRRGAELPDRRAIIILSDGINDPEDHGAEEDVKEKIQETRIPIYAIWFATNPASAKAQKGFRTLGRFADLSGGQRFPHENTPISESRLRKTYAALHQYLEQVFVITASCADCPLDGRDHPLRVSFKSGTEVLTNSTDLTMKPLPSPKIPSDEESDTTDGQQSLWPPTGWYLWLGIGLAAAMLSLIGGVILWRRSRRRRLKQEQEDLNRELRGASPIRPVSDDVPGRPTQEIALTVVSGAEPGRTYNLYLEDAATLGRSPESDLVLDDDPDISRSHCRLELREGTLFISDLESTHGTFLNGIRLYGPRPIQDGDKLTLGRTEVRLTIHGVA